MNQRLKQSIDRIASEARIRYQQVLVTARARTARVADRVADGKKPLNTLTGLGLKLSSVSYRTADKLLKQQTKLLENQLDSVALRLQKAAAAGSIRELVGTQVQLLPEQFGRLASDARGSLDIVLKGGNEARRVVGGVVKSLRNRPATVKPARKKAVRKTATKTARRTTTVSPAARKAPAARVTTAKSDPAA